MFGHLKGQRKANEMQDLNVWVAVAARIYSKIQKSENHREMQDSHLLLTLSKNQAVESCDPKSASKVEEMSDSENEGTSN